MLKELIISLLLKLPFSSAMSGDLVRLQHVAPVGGPITKVAEVTGLF